MRVVSLVKLQLVGVTALFIASKYEEVMSPSIQSFLYMAEDGYVVACGVRALGCGLIQYLISMLLGIPRVKLCVQSDTCSKSSNSTCSTLLPSPFYEEAARLIPMIFKPALLPSI